MARELFEKIKDLEKCLLLNRFKKIDERYDLEAFGNELAVYSSLQLKLRIVKDRGCFYVEALPADSNSDEWILITRVLNYLKDTSSLYFKKSKKKIEWDCLVDEICTNLILITTFFDQKNYSENVVKLDLFEKKQK